MTLDWGPLRQSLAACRAAGVDVPFWWRDDDAVAVTPALERLMELSGETGCPVHLAIIPAHADPALAAEIDTDVLIPVVHGWAHADHSAAGEKKNEFQTPRSGAIDEAAQGFARMRALFGDDLRPMFVPPWNRVNDTVVTALPAQGYGALSTFGPRAHVEAAGDLAQINTHLDPIWWKGTRNLVSPEHLIAQTAAHLEARRTGTEDATEPFGLLTHHLVHTPAIWSFTRAFLHEMMAGGATPWVMEKT